ncbi:hypothetical protein [Glycomyces xiaoerkulensis]|uniref:hypothetical protein n=1 Tax=Glycomyces xiaoerkulensis TaxID=2038139 RepID=UPI0012FFF235|nr:hypothetical protein [Glycomyces xiaoerkulensis]
MSDIELKVPQTAMVRIRPMTNPMIPSDIPAIAEPRFVAFPLPALDSPIPPNTIARMQAIHPKQATTGIQPMASPMMPKTRAVVPMPFSGRAAGTPPGTGAGGAGGNCGPTGPVAFGFAFSGDRPVSDSSGVSAESFAG